MDRYSKIQSSVWSSEKFEKLDQIDKFVYLYLLSTPHGNSIGLYKLKSGYASVDLGINKKEYLESMERLSRAYLIHFDNDTETIFVPNFLKFNPFTNENHAKGSKALADKFASNPLYPLFYEDLEKYCDKYLHVFLKPIESLSEDCRNTDTDTDTDTDTETDTNTETEDTLSPIEDDATENNQEHKKVPHKFLQGMYNTTCLSLPDCRDMTDKRKDKLRILFRNLGEDSDKIIELFKRAEASDFLSGRNGKWTNCNFDWLINYNNAIKVLEGNYENNRDKNKQATSGNAFLDYANTLDDDDNGG